MSVCTSGSEHAAMCAAADAGGDQHTLEQKAAVRLGVWLQMEQSGVAKFPGRCHPTLICRRS